MSIKHPEKGEYIDPEVLAEHLGAEPGTERYQLGLVSLQSSMMLQAEKDGAPVVVKVEHRGLRVLTDVEATHYLVDRHQAGVRCIKKASHRRSYVDEQNLDLDARRHHREWSLRQASMVHAVESEEARQSAKKTMD